jgi:hypothetical protein
MEVGLGSPMGGTACGVVIRGMGPALSLRSVRVLEYVRAQNLIGSLQSCPVSGLIAVRFSVMVAPYRPDTLLSEFVKYTSMLVAEASGPTTVDAGLKANAWPVLAPWGPCPHAPKRMSAQRLPITAFMAQDASLPDPKAQPVTPPHIRGVQAYRGILES